jgi:predicted nucleic acid-binding protein
MIYLVDVNVLSEPTRVTPNPKVIEWLAAHERDIVVDPVILGELRIGIMSLQAGRKRSRLETWFEAVAKTIECLPWDSTVSLRWARLVVDLRQGGRTLPVLDSMIAATALVHGLTVATRNVRDFQTAGIEVVDPFV